MARRLDVLDSLDLSPPSTPASIGLSGGRSCGARVVMEAKRSCESHSHELRSGIPPKWHPNAFPTVSQFSVDTFESQLAVLTRIKYIRGC
jgi:hypothetical protein